MPNDNQVDYQPDDQPPWWMLMVFVVLVLGGTALSLFFNGVP